MSEREKFFDRWSRRKQEAENEAKRPNANEPKSDALENQSRDEPSEDAALPAQHEKQPVFDPKSLPSLDSITATTDIRAFLAAGVPDELKQAALQRAWRADPAIRDFIGLSENSWDFNDPNGIHGFGPLEVTKQMKAAVEAMFDRKPPLSEPAADETKESGQPKLEPSAELAPPEGEDATIDQILESGSKPSAAALQNTPKDEKIDTNTRRAHGRALPK